MKNRSISIILCLVFLSVSISRAADIPFLTGRVTDNAQIVDEETRETLTECLKLHEDRTTNQVVILTIPTLDGESIEDYAFKVFQEWKLGQENKDNGILIVVAPNDRCMRIEVGYGLEATLTDLTANRIIQNIMTPKFRNEEYSSGILDGTQAVIRILEGGNATEVAGTDEGDVSSLGFLNSDMDDLGLTIIERILIGAFIFGILGVFTVLGIFTPAFGWFIYFFLIPFWAVFPIIVLGVKGAVICLIAYLILFPAVKLILRNSRWYERLKTDFSIPELASARSFTSSSESSGGSWSSSSSFSSGSGGFSGGGWSSGSRGFSGGGGSSGGGGASGRW